MRLTTRYELASELGEKYWAGGAKSGAGSWTTSAR